MNSRRIYEFNRAVSTVGWLTHLISMANVDVADASNFTLRQGSHVFLKANDRFIRRRLLSGVIIGLHSSNMSKG
jgi:hypothetical protein